MATQKKSTKKAAKKTTRSSTTSAKKSTKSPKATVAKKAAVKKTPAAQATTIIAEIDVGWGNNLTIRGQGAGLCWDKGIPMEHVGNNQWSWTTKRAKEPLSFKVIANDYSWSQGDDFQAHPGSTTHFTPYF